MEIRIISSRFTVVSGDAVLWYGEAPSMSNVDSTVLGIVDTAIRVPGKDSSGDVGVFISNAIVRDDDGTLARVAPFVARGHIDADAIERNLVQVDLGPRTVVRLGTHRHAPVRIGVATNDGTFECDVDEQGEARFLLSPGSYVAYTLDEPAGRTSFEIKTAEVATRCVDIAI